MSEMNKHRPSKVDHSQLFQTEEGLSLLADMAQFGIWEWDLKTSELRWDDTMYRIYGVSPEDFTGRYEDWAATLDEATRERSEAAFRALLEEDKYFDVELDIKRASDGKHRILRGLARLFRDETGAPVRVFGINEDITDRVLAARKLEVEEAKFRSLFEASSVGFAMNDYETGEFLAFNRALYEPTGYTADEFVGLSYWDLTPSKYMPQEEQMLRDMARTGSYGPFEKEYIRKDGSTYPILLRGTKIRTLEGREVIWSVIQDISAIKQAQTELEIQKERFEGIFEMTSSGVAIYEAVDQGHDFRFVGYNPAAERIDGLSREDVMGRTLLECFPWSDEMGLIAALREVWETGKAVELPLVEYADDRMHAWRENKIFKLSTGEVVAVYTDLTEVKHAQLAAERASEARAQFVANMSHEIRTPLNAVLGIADVLSRTSLTDEQLGYLDKIRGASRLLLGVINDILDLSKIEAGELRLESLPFDLADTVERLSALFSDAASEKGLVLDMPNDLRQLPTLIGDELRLSQVLANLLSNAIKFTGSGGVRLTIETVSTTESDLALLFAVADTGIGIDGARLEAMFEPFQQADTSTTRVYGGTGLGLTISQYLVDKMGGRIWASSSDDGSVFYVQVSFALAAGSRQIEQRFTPDSVIPPKLAGYTILVVEDNPLNQLVTRKFLEETEVHLLLAENGLDAVAVVNESKVDLVLMDLQMPLMDGFEATRQLRQHYPDLPIIALSAAVLEDERGEAMAAGMNDHLCKPVVREALYELLHRYLLEPAAGQTTIESAESASAQSLLPEALPGVDLDLGRASLGDDGFYRELLAMFLGQLDSEYAPLSASYTGQPLDEAYRRLLHTLKGGAATIGAVQLSESAAALEAAISADHGIVDAMAEFQRALDEVHAGLRHCFASG
jgi:PAS domain S-box-containing protein